MIATCVSYAMYAVKSSSPPYSEMLWKIGLGQNICAYRQMGAQMYVGANDRHESNSV